MKISIVAILSTLAVASAFTPSTSTQRATVAMNAEPLSRMAFLSAAAASVVGAAGAANAMDQEYVSTVTEQWETGSPTPAAKTARKERFANARTQLTSNFPPIKRLTLERKSPVTRLDINAPNFGAYKRTYPGLFREASK